MSTLTCLSVFRIVHRMYCTPLEHSVCLTSFRLHTDKVRKSTTVALQETYGDRGRWAMESRDLSLIMLHTQRCIHSSKVQKPVQMLHTDFSASSPPWRALDTIHPQNIHMTRETCLFVTVSAKTEVPPNSTQHFLHIKNLISIKIKWTHWLT